LPVHAMRIRPAMAIGAGALLYLLLLCLSHLAAQDPKAGDVLQENWVEVISTILGWFLPALLAGSLTRARPVIVGIVLGVLMVLVDFGAVVVLYGWDWAVAALGSSAGSSLLSVLFAVVFAFAGWKTRVLLDRLNADEARDVH
jgi:hypothetical protein